MFADPGLFPADSLAEFMSGPAFAQVGWQAVYRVGVPVVGAERLSRLLPFGLAAGTLLLARLGTRGSFAGGSPPSSRAPS